MGRTADILTTAHVRSSEMEQPQVIWKEREDVVGEEDQHMTNRGFHSLVHPELQLDLTINCCCYFKKNLF